MWYYKMNELLVGLGFVRDLGFVRGLGFYWLSGDLVVKRV